MPSYTVNVVDASGAPVPNPQVFLNGMSVNSPEFGLEAGQSATVQASAQGYTPATQVVTGTADTTPQTVTMQLASQSPPSAVVPFEVTMQPPVPNMAPALFVGSTGYNPVVSPDGSGYFYNVPPGQYSATFHDPSGQFQTQTTTLTVPPGGGSQTVSMVAASDPGNQTGVGSQPSTNASDPHPEDSIPIPAISGSEAISSNTSFQGYYTSAQVNASINGIILDELNTIQWALQANTIPLYGYASRDADAYGAGRALVQGQLVLNYVTENYLLTVIQTDPITAVTANVSFGNADQEAATQLSQLLQRQNQVGSLPAGQQAAVSSSLNQRVDSALASATPAVVTLARALSRQQKRDGYSNPLYYPVTFDIRIEIGTGQAKTYRLLERCKLTSNEVICDQSGQPILEAYGFIARRAR